MSASIEYRKERDLPSSYKFPPIRYSPKYAKFKEIILINRKVFNNPEYAIEFLGSKTSLPIFTLDNFRIVHCCRTKDIDRARLNWSHIIENPKIKNPNDQVSSNIRYLKAIMKAFALLNPIPNSYKTYLIHF
jgi:hypothetical protein